MTEIDVTELRAKLAAATEGPWEWRNDQMSTPSWPVEQWTIYPGVLIADTNDGTPGGDEIDRANADLIISAVNALPALLDELEALRAWKADAQKLIESNRTLIKEFAEQQRTSDALDDLQRLGQEFDDG